MNGPVKFRRGIRKERGDEAVKKPRRHVRSSAGGNESAQNALLHVSQKRGLRHSGPILFTGKGKECPSRRCTGGFDPEAIRQKGEIERLGVD